MTLKHVSNVTFLKKICPLLCRSPQIFLITVKFLLLHLQQWKEWKTVPTSFMMFLLLSCSLKNKNFVF